MPYDSVNKYDMNLRDEIYELSKLCAEVQTRDIEDVSQQIFVPRCEKTWITKDEVTYQQLRIGKLSFLLPTSKSLLENTAWRTTQGKCNFLIER